MSRIRCKFKIQQLRPTGNKEGDKELFALNLVAEYDQAIPEDQAFQKWTPTGHMEVYISNPDAVRALQSAQYCYVDLTPIVVDSNPPEQIPPTGDGTAQPPVVDRPPTGTGKPTAHEAPDPKEKPSEQGPKVDKSPPDQTPKGKHSGK
jgi:hypothetical protein